MNQFKADKFSNENAVRTWIEYDRIEHMGCEKNLGLIKGLLWQLRLNSKSFIVERVVPSKIIL